MYSLNKNWETRLIRSTLLLIIITCSSSLTACADDQVDTSDSASPAAANNDAANYHSINGKKVRLASEGDLRYVNYDNDGSFRDAALGFSMSRNIPLEEILRLNGWEEVADENAPKGVAFWVHPSFRRSE